MSRIVNGTVLTPDKHTLPLLDIYMSTVEFSDEVNFVGVQLVIILLNTAVLPRNLLDPNILVGADSVHLATSHTHPAP